MTASCIFLWNNESRLSIDLSKLIKLRRSSYHFWNTEQSVFDLWSLIQKGGRNTLRLSRFNFFFFPIIILSRKSRFQNHLLQHSKCWDQYKIYHKGSKRKGWQRNAVSALLFTRISCYNARRLHERQHVYRFLPINRKQAGNNWCAANSKPS